MRKRLGIHLWSIHRQRSARPHADVGAALGDERFERSYIAGTTLNQGRRSH